MQDLTQGTERQITWATSIRNTMIANANAILHDPNPYGNGQAANEYDIRKARASLRNLSALTDAKLLIDFTQGTLPFDSPYRGADTRYFMTLAENNRIHQELNEDVQQAEEEVYGSQTSTSTNTFPRRPRRHSTPEEREARKAKDARIHAIIHRLGEEREAIQ